MLSVVCIGIIEAGIVMNVNGLPNINNITEADKLDIISGGGAINTAINISVIGTKTSVCGKIGGDIFGGFLLSRLQSAGVNTEGLLISNSLLTPSTVIFKTPESSFLGVRYKGTNSDYSLSDIDWTIIEKSDVVYISSLMSLAKFNNAACEMFLKKCRQMGKKTILDIKLDYLDLSESWLGGLSDLLKYIDYFLLGYDEAVALTGHKFLEEAAAALTTKGAKTCVIRCGAKGSYIKESAASVGYLLPAYKNIHVVDCTGAGDAFCSGFVYGISCNMSVRQSALIGNAVGAMSIMDFGATTNVKSYSEVKRFMERTVT